jgi:ABC-2 type transport system permease protein
MIRPFHKVINFLPLLAIVVFINILAGYLYTEIDLTEDKRFTLSGNTKKLISGIDENITIRVLLDGDFPAGFKRLQSSTNDMLQEFKDLNPNISYAFEDPSEGSLSDIEKRRKQLTEENIIPVNLSFFDGTQMIQKAVFPYAIIYLGSKKFVVNLLEEQKPGDDEEIILNNSVALLEYKFTSALQKLSYSRPKNILFLQGNGEWDESQTFRLEAELKKLHNTFHVNLDTLMKLDSIIDLVIITGPKVPVSLQNQFKLDQYIMGGGNVIWLIDKFHVSLDSINKYKFYIPQETITGYEDMLFKYGVRIMPDLIMDLECSQIPQVVGMSGDKPQTRLFPWPYHMAAAASQSHPVVKNLDRINLFFPSSIDTVKTNGNVKKTILLTSSAYSKQQLAPMRLSFEMLKTAPDPQKFNSGNRPVAVCLEGTFESFFKNRLTPEFQEVLNNLGVKFVESGKPAKLMVVSDSDFAKNLVQPSTGNTEDVGYNKWERRFYKGNKDLIINMAEYILDDGNILESRSKEIKLRLLDTVKTRQEKVKWQIINVVTPVLMIALFGFLFTYIRKRRYSGYGS